MTDKNKFKGVLPALLTPFDKDGNVCKSSVDKLIRYNLKKGVNGFYVGGSTGEGILLTIEERIALFNYAAEANEGKSTLIAHVGTIATKHAIEMAKGAEKAGFDAISAVAPYYFKFGSEAIKQYYYDIASSVSIPMIIYNFPGANGFSLDKETAENMFAANDKFIGIKHTTSDMYALQQFKTMKADPIVYNGFDEMFLGGLAMGADGGIGSTYNFMAEKFLAIYDAFKKGDIKEAQRVQNEANEIINVLIKYGVFASEKYVLDCLGIPMGGCRKPFLPLCEEGKSVLAEIAKQFPQA